MRNSIRRGRRVLCGPGFRDPGRDIFVLRTETESPGDYRQLYGGMESGHSASRATPAFASLHIYSRPVQPLSSSDDVSSHCRPDTPGYLRRYVIRMDCGNTNRKGAQMAGTRHTSRCGSGEDDVVRVAHPRVVLGGKRLIQSSPSVRVELPDPEAQSQRPMAPGRFAVKKRCGRNSVHSRPCAAAHGETGLHAHGGARGA